MRSREQGAEHHRVLLALLIPRLCRRAPCESRGARGHRFRDRQSCRETKRFERAFPINPGQDRNHDTRHARSRVRLRHDERRIGDGINLKSRDLLSDPCEIRQRIVVCVHDHNYALDAAEARPDRNAFQKSADGVYPTACCRVAILSAADMSLRKLPRLDQGTQKCLVGPAFADDEAREMEFVAWRSFRQLTNLAACLQSGLQQPPRKLANDGTVRGMLNPQ